MTTDREVPLVVEDYKSELRVWTQHQYRRLDGMDACVNCGIVGVDIWEGAEGGVLGDMQIAQIHCRECKLKFRDISLRVLLGRIMRIPTEKAESFVTFLAGMAKEGENG